MHFVNAAVALVAAMTFSATALGEARTSTAVFTEPEDGITSAGPPPCTATSCKSKPRYKNKRLVGEVEFENNYPTCTFISSGDWRPGFYPISKQFDVQPKDKGTPAGTVDISEPPSPGHPPVGCDGTGGPYNYAPIYFEWTLHKNLTAVPGFGPTAEFSSTWYSPTGCMPPKCHFVVPYSFQITVPVVRPASETTAFRGWDLDPKGLTDGRWKQTLHPPADDPTFDFSGESVKEADAAGTHSDTCWFPASAFKKSNKITGGKWIVQAGNVWYFDYVGWLNPAVTYYRLPHGAVPARAPCVTRFPQQLKIKAPPDTSRINYAGINGLGGNIGLTTVTSKRAGSSKTKTWP